MLNYTRSTSLMKDVPGSTLWMMGGTHHCACTCLKLFYLSDMAQKMNMENRKRTTAMKHPTTWMTMAFSDQRLVELSRSVLDRKTDAKLPEFREEIELLHDAIDLYLKKEPVTPNEAHPNEPLAVVEHPRAGKRIRRAITALNRMMHRR
ncbi:hypothetical protein GALMADRAFT_765381 [Galerina marginata CBS 339.88]|uniref:Uncharacterized protein n=1 Tax=Galerina marginata (strain CBS 339.88) TaxID=685588 RepID=A0A067SWU8_GALM3|nr:hypothetical protein GALMADRAFT_765381 [Galerina marginata CBS 339.88]